MNTSQPFLIVTLLIAAALTGCQKPTAERAAAGETKVEGAGDTVQLKEGHGLALHPKVKASINLKIAEVGEEKVAPEFKADLHVIQGADSGLRKVALTSDALTEANGWLSAEKAAHIRPGQEVALRVDSLGGATLEKGVVKRVEKSPYATLGDFEVVVETAAPLATGTRLNATFRAPAGDAVPAVPRSALLKTAEGWFVYAINESFYLRTAVKVGAMNNELVEITDGLYAGDQIVTSPVNDLWMAELQILRGGKACTCGH
jgi:hypothetical protein